MADINKLSPIIADWEGKYVDDPTDKGGCTNMGVTIAAFRKYINPKGTCDDLSKLTTNDFSFVLRRYWDMWKADQIKDQKLANILVDWVWGSGSYGIKIPQRVLGLPEDGVVGPNTLNAVNSANPTELLGKIYKAREKYLDDIVANNPSQRKFIKGWKNRLKDFA